MTDYLDKVTEACVDFLTTEPYTHEVEIAGKRDFKKGTKMGLSSSAVSLEIDVVETTVEEEWEKVAYDLYCTAELTHLGDLMLDQSFEPTELNDKGFIVGLRANGSLGIWGLGYNERLRMIWKMTKFLENPDIANLANFWQDNFREGELKIYKEMLLKIAYVYDQINDASEAKKRISDYIVHADKDEAAIFSSEGIDYLSIRDSSNILKIVVKLSEFIKMISANLYGPKRVNPKYFVPALRQRAPDMKPSQFEKVKEDKQELVRNKGSKYKYKVRMSRSRRPQGDPPYNNIWMFLTRLEKVTILKWCMAEFKKLFGINFTDPITNPNFYYEFTHFVPNLYIFGDNGLLIKSKSEFYCYDLSISDVMQGFLRRDKDGNNLQTFMRLTSEFDLGPTGDPFTTVWTIAGQLCIWKWHIVNKRKGAIPYITGFIEDSETFLGHKYDKSRHIWRTTSPHFTRDSASDRISMDLKKDNGHESWPAEITIEDTTVAQTACAAGLVTFGLAEFYAWVKDQNIEWSEVEYAEGVQRRMSMMLPKELIPSFMSHFKRERLEELAYPRKLITVSGTAALAES